MNYDKIKEEGVNIAKIAGQVSQPLTLSHEIDGEKFYEFKIDIERLSKIKDTLPVTISERTMLGINLAMGDFVELVGEYRSYNKLLGEKSKLILNFFAKECELSEKQQFENYVKLTGFICKTPVYRKTPFEREICDVLLAVNRQSNHKSDYIPCILWGRNARFIANQNIGCKVEVVGRIQSRPYKKMLVDGSSQDNIAYEVSCQSIAIIGNVTNLSKNKTQQIEAANN